MEFYKSRNSDRKRPKRNLKRFDKPSRSFRNSRNDNFQKDQNNESAIVTCADCGRECEIPFVPKHDRPVYCSDCFKLNKPRGLDDQRRDNFRYQNDQRTEKHSPRLEKTRTEKFLKKQESFYADGSEKFYASLKEKLFEILGGKICTGCGFKDVRALGFCHVYDSELFDNIRRGGFASSWGKYISDPELARKELRVLCLNCNEIREPISKPKETKPKPYRKKSKFFPR